MYLNLYMNFLGLGMWDEGWRTTTCDCYPATAIKGNVK